MGRERVCKLEKACGEGGREGSVSQSQHLSSLHQGWGTLRPFASLAADLTPFHQCGHLFFFFFVLAIRAASDCFISSPLSARQDRAIYLFTKTSPGIAKGAFLQRTLVKLQFHPGRRLWSLLLLWISPSCSAGVLFGAADRLWESYLWQVRLSKDRWRWQNLCFRRREVVSSLLVAAAKEDGSLLETCILPSDPCTSPGERLPQGCRGVERSGSLSYSAGLSSLQENPVSCLHGNLDFHRLTFAFLCFFSSPRGRFARIDVKFKDGAHSGREKSRFRCRSCAGMPRIDIFSRAPCVLREHWHYLLWRSPCCSSLCLCFHSDNSCAYMGSRHWPRGPPK